MTFKSLARRFKRVTKFGREATSLSAVPALVIAAIARDNPFGHAGIWSSALGKWFGVVKVRTAAMNRQFAIINTHDLGHLISCEEVLIDQIYDLSLVPFRPDLIVDCGAHIGLFTLIAGLRYASAELIAFEPNVCNFRVAQEQLSRFSSRLDLVEAAVSTEEGEAWFSDGESNSGHLTDEPHERRQRVKSVDLRDVARRWAGRSLLLKMDIEGAEKEVLPHIIDYLPTHCAIFVEVHGGERLWKQLSTIASEAGFQIARTRERDRFTDCIALRC
jgi:FkbM family methyltransferase